SLTVTADSKTRAYGDSNPALTYTVTGFVNGETLATSGVTGGPSLTTTPTPPSPVDSYSLTTGLATLAAGNYDFSFVSGTLTVTRAQLDITASDKGRAYGDPNPILDGTYSGAKNGETFTIAGSTSATPSSAVGSYAVAPSATGAT